jgi:hypothetical protein
LLEDGVGEDRVIAVEQSAASSIEQAVELALAAPYPDPEREAATEYRA